MDNSEGPRRDASGLVSDAGGADGFLHVERLVDGFAAPLLARWRALDVNHSLSVVLFARVADVDTRARDVYRVVLENVEKADPATLVAALKRELVAFARSLATVVPADRLRVCRAADGNVLEAINLTLNVLEKHYMDRDTLRTGNSIVLVSAGAGVFSVDARLAQITKQRMMDNGIGMDMLSLAVPPLHTAPIFMFRGRSGPRATAHAAPRGDFSRFGRRVRLRRRSCDVVETRESRRRRGRDADNSAETRVADALRSKAGAKTQVRGPALDQPVVRGPGARGGPELVDRRGGAAAR